MYQVSLPCIAWFACLKSEEVVMGKKCLRPFFVHGRHGNAEKHVYQVSLPCIVWFASLRSEEVVLGKKCLRPFFVCGRHGNAEIHMRTKFHLHALYGVQV